MKLVPNDKYKDTYSESYTVLSHDIDACHRVRPSVYLRYMQETANHQMRDCKPTYDELFESGLAFVLSRVRVDILQPLLQYDKIVVQTWPHHDCGFTFTRSYRIIRDGNIVALGSSAWALVNMNNKSFVHCDEELLKNYYHADKLEKLPLRFPMPRVKLDCLGERTVYYNDIDQNGHMNNTNYPDVLTNFIDDARRAQLKSMIIGYDSEARLGDVMKVFGYCEETDSQSVNYIRTVIDDRVNVEAKFVYEY